MTEQIQIYAYSVNSTSENMQQNVILTGIDASQVLNEFTIEERLDSVDPADIADYLTKLTEEAMEDAKEVQYA